MDPASMIRGLKRGEEGATQAFVDSYYQPILGYLFRMLHGRQCAEDVCQETFVRAMQRIDQVRDPQALKSWLYRIATNLAHDYLRRHGREGIDSATVDSESSRSSRSNEVTPDLSLGERLYVADLLSRLAEEHRAIVVLRFYEDMSLQAISEVLEIPLGTVKSRLHYALRKLREYVRAEEKEVSDNAFAGRCKTSPSHVS